MCNDNRPDAAELAEREAEMAAERRAEQPGPQDRTPDECPW